MKEYVVTTGPLKSFDHIYEPRLDKIEGLAEYPAIEITEKAMPDHAMASYRREHAGEFAFLEGLFSSLIKGHSAYYGFRDIEKSVAWNMMQKLRRQSDISWCRMNYWKSDDDLVLCELKNFHRDMAFLKKFYPPAEGEIFFYLTEEPFDLFEIYWERRSSVSQKFPEDPIHRDVFAYAHKAKLTLHCDSEGAFTVVHQPDFLDDATIERHITQAGLKAQMSITFAPGLFS